MYHGENIEKMTQYGEFGCIFSHNYAFKFLISYMYINIIILSVEGSSIVLHIECLGGACSFEIFFKKWHSFMSFSEYSDINLS